MALSMTKGGLNLNDEVNYWLYDDFDLGEADVDESWVWPKYPGARPGLARQILGVAVMTLPILVKGSSTADLDTRVNNVRGIFATAGNLIFVKGPVSKTIKTYQSVLPPAIAGQEHAALHVHQGSFLVRRWTLRVKREPSYSGESVPIVI